MSDAEPEPEVEVEAPEGAAAPADGAVDAVDGAEPADGAAGDPFANVKKNSNGTLSMSCT